MTIQPNVNVTVTYAAESSFGVAASAGAAAQVMRRMTSSLNPGKDVFGSNEARPDQQVVDVRHGTKRPAGTVEGELTHTAYDGLIEAVMRGTWANGIAASASDYTTVAAATSSGTALQQGSIGTFTWAAGDPIAKGFRLGDVIRTVGSTGNDGQGGFRITGFGGSSNRTVTVTPAPAAHGATALTSFACPGKKVQNGILRRSFSIEENYADIDGGILFSGMRAGSMAVRIPPNGMSTIAFGFMGRDQLVLEGPTSPYFSAATAPGTARLIAGPSGLVRFGGGEQAVLTSLDLTVDLSLSADPVVGSTVVPDIFESTMRVGGNVSFFLQDMSLVKVFTNEQEVDLCATLFNGGVTTPDFINFNLQRVKTTGISKSVGAQGGVIVTSPYTGLLATAAAGIDGATLSVSRSI